MSEDLRPLWHREPCWECGQEGLATRTIATPKSKPYVCEPCEVLARASHELDELQDREEATREAERLEALSLLRRLVKYCDEERPATTCGTTKFARHVERIRKFLGEEKRR